ncbi:MAG: hypothetical protein FWD11_05480 [Micrococcales bacterium]|nr:hypothetical protein [Micrococcales bacterium]
MEPPASDLRKGFMLAFLSVPVGMVLAFAVSYLAYPIGMPRAALAAPGAVAGFVAVWLFRRKVGDVTMKGLVRLVIIGVVQGLACIGAALAADVVYLTGAFGSEYVAQALTAVIQSSLAWYAIFVACCFGGLYGALRRFT